MERSRLQRIVRPLRAFSFAGAVTTSSVFGLPSPNAEAQNPREQIPTPTPSPIFRPQSPAEIKEFKCDGVMVNVTYYDLPGQITASGEPMDNSALTIAIPRKPENRRLREKLGDKIQLTDISTRRSVILRANDTGLMGEGNHQHLSFDVPLEVARNMGWVEQGVTSVCSKLVEKSE